MEERETLQGGVGFWGKIGLSVEAGKMFQGS